MTPHEEAAILSPVLGRMMELEKDRLVGALPWLKRNIAETAWKMVMAWLPTILEKCLTLFAARYGHVTLGDLAELLIAAAAKLPTEIRTQLPPPPQ